MANLTDLGARVNQLIELGEKTLATAQQSKSLLAESWVDAGLFSEFKTAVLSFIKSLFGETHPYYTNFVSNTMNADPRSTRQGLGILNSIKREIDGGWLISMKGLVSADVFNDFFEMAEHLLSEGYKDAAAVMIGSVLEEHLRQLCNKNGLPTHEMKAGKSVPKKADLLNAELKSANIYNLLDQKNVTAWLDLRNNAAHGKYAQYNQQQVESMLKGVSEFISRNSI